MSDSTGISDGVSESSKGNPLLLLVRQRIETADESHPDNPIVLLNGKMLGLDEILLASLCDV